jgi:ankyrin repeat protein
MATLLVDVGADINARHKNGLSPLDHAIITGNDCVVEVLLNKGAIITDVRIGQAQRTTLHAVAIKGYSRIAEMLLSHRAPIDANDAYGHTPLHLAVSEGHLEIVRALLCAGATVDIQDKVGDSLVHVAAGNGYIAIVQELLNRGADPSLQGHENATLLHRASLLGFVDVVQCLLEAGVKVSAQKLRWTDTSY